MVTVTDFLLPAQKAVLSENLPNALDVVTTVGYVVPGTLSATYAVTERGTLDMGTLSADQQSKLEWVSRSGINPASLQRLMIMRRSQQHIPGAAPRITAVWHIPDVPGPGDSTRFSMEGTNLNALTNVTWRFYSPQGNPVAITTHERSPVLKIPPGWGGKNIHVELTVWNDYGIASSHVSLSTDTQPSTEPTQCQILNTCAPPPSSDPEIQPVTTGKGEIVSVSATNGLIRAGEGTSVVAVLKNMGLGTLSQGAISTMFDTDGATIGQATLNQSLNSGAEVVLTVPIAIGTIGSYDIGVQAVATQGAQGSERGATSVAVWSEEAALNPPWWEQILKEPLYLVGIVAGVGLTIALAVGLRRPPQQYY